MAPSDVRVSTRVVSKRGCNQGHLCNKQSSSSSTGSVATHFLLWFLPHFQQGRGHWVGCVHTYSLLTLEPEMLPIQVHESRSVSQLSCFTQLLFFYSSVTLCFAHRSSSATLKTGRPVSQLDANVNISALWC